MDIQVIIILRVILMHILKLLSGENATDCFESVRKIIPSLFYNVTSARQRSNKPQSTIVVWFRKINGKSHNLYDILLRLLYTFEYIPVLYAFIRISNNHSYDKVVFVQCLYKMSQDQFLHDRFRNWKKSIMILFEVINRYNSEIVHSTAKSYIFFLLTTY